MRKLFVGCVTVYLEDWYPGSLTVFFHQTHYGIHKTIYIVPHTSVYLNFANSATSDDWYEHRSWYIMFGTILSHYVLFTDRSLWALHINHAALSSSTSDIYWGVLAYHVWISKSFEKVRMILWTTKTINLDCSHFVFINEIKSAEINRIKYLVVSIKLFDHSIFNSFQEWILQIWYRDYQILRLNYSIFVHFHPTRKMSHYIPYYRFC